MVNAENPIINALGNWVLKGINLKGYIFGDLAPEVKLIDIKKEGRLTNLPDEKKRQTVLAGMGKSPIIEADSTPVASLASSGVLSYYAPVQTYNSEADEAKADCINDYCPAYFRIAGVACLGCTRKRTVTDYWMHTKITR
jgi:hypothetical protein